ncbi:MAG: right-handed parallel beta-helix repeat-containing protein [Asgard group archaeon]|nr:right-handed parallel beta-helix repeat-containing protein [Asgard group archaeon]
MERNYLIISKNNSRLNLKIFFKLAIIFFVLSFGLFISKINSNSIENMTAKEFQIDNQITGDFDNQIDDFVINAIHGPYYYVWNESLWEESSTDQWTPYWLPSSDYIYSWSSSGSYFSFIENGAEYSVPKEINTGVYRTNDFRWDTVDIHAKIEFDIRFRTFDGEFEDSWCTWQVGRFPGYTYGTSDIDDIVEEGWIGGNDLYTVYHAGYGDWTKANIRYNTPTIALGGVETFSIGTIGDVEELTFMGSEDFECYISNIRVFDVQFRRYITTSELAGIGGDTIYVDGDGFQRNSEIQAVWLGENRISGNHLVGSTNIDIYGEIADDFGFRIPMNIVGSYDNISIETDYQTTTFNASTGFPGFTVNPGIKILDNDDFALYASQGTGFAGDPYIIENLNFDLNEFNSHGVFINNTDAYFKISNSTIFNSSTGYNGIHLYNVTNGVLDNVTIYDCKDDGIQMKDTKWCNITDNAIHNNSKAGIALFNNSHDNNLMFNNISSNSGSGLDMNRYTTGCYDNNVTRNLIEYNDLYGINTTGSNNRYYRNYIWLNLVSSILDNGINEDWIENLTNENGDYDSDSVLNRNEVYMETDPFSADSDSDGMPDGYEVSNSLDPLNYSDAFLDADSDGLLNLYEYQNNTDLYDSDSDDDTLLDGDEVLTHGTDPNDPDTDGDGIDDSEELVLGSDGYITDPNDSDTDDDNLTDFEEIDTYGTNPLIDDTDSDGLNDGDEISEGTDPLEDDSDADGLIDGDEVSIYNTDPLDDDSDDDLLTDGQEVLTYLTNPNNDDSDADGLTDGQEILLNTDPLDIDTDDDTINDFEETILGDDGYITDPTDEDTDGDGIDDGTEVANGFDPTDPNNPPTEVSPLFGSLIGLIAFVSFSFIIINLLKRKRK